MNDLRMMFHLSKGNFSFDLGEGRSAARFLKLTKKLRRSSVFVAKHTIQHNPRVTKKLRRSSLFVASYNTTSIDSVGIFCYMQLNRRLLRSRVMLEGYCYKHRIYGVECSETDYSYKHEAP